MRVQWSKIETAKFSVEKASEGGEAFADVKYRLAEAGIPCRRTCSCYIGQYGIEVPKADERRAEGIVFP